uniref:Uncharacterized protein n=1 Tax=Seriola dumerili TaxID=41447 RepID=A0A3B4T3U1_SERDU
MIVLPVLIWETLQRSRGDHGDQRQVKLTPLNRTRRQVQHTSSSDSALCRYGGIELNYTKGQKTAWVFDLCTVIKCGSREQDWKRYDVYLCVTGYQPKKGPLCGAWSQVWWNSRPGRWTHTPDRTSRWYEDHRALKTKIDITRTSHGVGDGVNPIMLTADAISRNKASKENPAEYFVLGVEQPGTDTMGLIKVNFLDTIPNVATTTAPSKTEEQTEVVSKDMIKLSTGYMEKNMWLDWVTSTAGEKGLSDCLVCASPRTDPQGFRCMLAMHTTPTPSNCSTLVSLFPVVKNTTVPPVFTPREGNYTCLNRKKTGYINAPVMMGKVSSDWCSLMVDVTGWANMSTLVWARADLFLWIGTCTMTRLAVPFNMVGRKLKAQMTARIKRNTADFDWMSSSPTYIDAIGVPRGVPNEFKLANQIAEDLSAESTLTALLNSIAFSGVTDNFMTCKHEIHHILHVCYSNRQENIS